MPVPDILAAPDLARLHAALAEHATANVDGVDPYLSLRDTEHSRDERVRSYLRLRPALAGAQRVLDWGCRHAPAAQLVRADFGPDIDLHGTDICSPDAYREFHERSALAYKMATHPWRLDYPDDFFDAVLAAGVLEHVPNTGASLTELWRVLRPDGALLISHLPNASSWSEWVSRRFYPAHAHARTYRLTKLRRQLLDFGFSVQAWGYHHLPPDTLPACLQANTGARITLRALRPLHLLESVWPVRALSAALWVIARKRSGF